MPDMRYISLFSGIEAASVAWHPLGWKAVAFAEIEPFPCWALAHNLGASRPMHMPDPDELGISEVVAQSRRAAIRAVADLPERAHVPNEGDIAQVDWSTYRDAGVNVLVGGSPCQSFSVAGLRKGLADPRGNLALEYLRAVDGVRPEWVVWENVPGVLSADGGRAFGTFLGGLAELGYGFAYRVLDAQYVRVESHARAVPQRRRRVFVVGCLGDWRRAAAVLLERESLRGHPAPRREAGKGTTVGFECGPTGGRFTDIAPTMDTRAKDGPIRNQLGVGAAEVIAFEPGIASRVGGHVYDDVSGTIRSAPGDNQMTLARAFYNEATLKHSEEVCHTLRSRSTAGGIPDGVQLGYAVRRLTPLECERLQGFPDGWTDVPYRNKPAADGPRYKAIGNSMAGNVMYWIGARIAEVPDA